MHDDDDSPDGPCFYCGEPTSHYAGNPGLWPLRFCQRDGTGITRYHHTHCVTDRLNAHAQCAPGVKMSEVELARHFLRIVVSDRNDQADVFDSARDFLTNFDVTSKAPAVTSTNGGGA